MNDLHICEKCGKHMLPFINIETGETAYICLPCDSLTYEEIEKLQQESDEEEMK